MLHKKRRKILAKLRPLYEALVIIPEGAVGPRRERLLDAYILNDQIPKGGDRLCVAALVTLETCETQLYDKCELRAARRDEAMQAFKVAWRLCGVPVHERVRTGSALLGKGEGVSEGASEWGCRAVVWCTARAVPEFWPAHLGAVAPADPSARSWGCGIHAEDC